MVGVYGFKGSGVKNGFIGFNKGIGGSVPKKSGVCPGTGPKCRYGLPPLDRVVDTVNNFTYEEINERWGAAS